MFSAVSRTGVLGAARTPLGCAPLAARNVRAFVATAAARKAEAKTEAETELKAEPETVEPQSVVAARALKHRPVSPHLSIYQPQMSWVMSGLHRNMGVLVGGGAYLWAAAYGLAPLVGADLSSVAVAGALATVPAPLLLAAKALVAGSLSFHSFNGIRHLWWDTGRSVTNQGVFNTGYAVIAASVLATGYLTFF